MRHKKISESRASRVLVGVLGVTIAVALAGCSSGGASPAAKADLTITPAPYRDGQHINLSVAPNSYFKPNASIRILQCADPGGTTAHLPVNASTCDGNTVQPGSVLTESDGSFSFHGYPIFALPNATTLGEPTDNQPVCDQTHYCVLYIGQNQEKFTAPKIFSPPFTVSKASGGS